MYKRLLNILSSFITILYALRLQCGFNENEFNVCSERAPVSQ